MPIAIVDYDVGNLRSVQKAFEKVGAEAIVTRKRSELTEADALVLPGVGAFGACMANLQEYGLVDTVKDFAASGKPFLGICIGYQILFEGSEEDPGTPGLGIFRGLCRRFIFPEGSSTKVPHMGWNNTRQLQDSPLLDGIDDGAAFYFVHSYYPVPDDPTLVMTSTHYGAVFASSIAKGNLFATQFHPEKSQKTGLTLLANFARLSE